MSELVEVEKDTGVPWMNAIANAKTKFNEINKVYNLVNYDKEAMFAMQIIQGNDYLRDIANNNPGSLRNAVIGVASTGLTLNPAEKLAYLVPRKGAACLDISYIGLIKLATDTGSIMWARAELVHENDEFIYKGATKEPEFSTPDPFNRGAVRGVYCVAKTKEGDYLSGIMSIQEVYDIRDRSEAYKAYLNKKKLCSWVTDEGEMIKKTIIKRESKTWPKTDKSGRFDNAIQYLNEEMDEGIDFGGQMILGMRMDELVDMNEVNESKVDKLYNEALELLKLDDPDPDVCRGIEREMNQWELIVFSKLLSKHKHERKGYHTIFTELTNTYNNPDMVETP